MSKKRTPFVTSLEGRLLIDVAGLPGWPVTLAYFDVWKRFPGDDRLFVYIEEAIEFAENDPEWHGMLAKAKAHFDSGNVNVVS